MNDKKRITSSPMDGIYITFASNLKTARAARSISAKDLSLKANLRQIKRVSDIEDGRGIPSLEEVVRICDALNIGLEAMLFKKLTVVIKYLDKEI